MKAIGLIGGMSWESTAHYYAVLNRTAMAQSGGLDSVRVLIDSVDFGPIARMQAEGRWDEAGAILAASASGLVAQGAGVIGLCTNTMHIVAAPIMAASGGRMIHIADPTAEALLADGIARVGLLGTRFTMEKPFYADRLRARGLDVLVPQVDVTNLNGIIYEELCKGIVRDESRQVYVRAIARLAQDGAEAVILGCTEIAMLINDDSSPLPTYDTTDLHARALLAAARA